MRYIILLLLLSACDRIALPDHRYKGTAVLHVIEKGAHESNERSYSPVSGGGVKFNFNFQEAPLPLDSALQKIYGLSDSWSNHLKYSARLAFRVRKDSTVDIFAYWHMNSDIEQQWLGNINLYEWHYGAVEIERDIYEFRLDEKVFRIKRDNKSVWGAKYRLFPYYEDAEGKGAPERTAITIEEI